ncbi:hypothetical protein OAS95_03510 [Pelagibacteraceae bacterium]|jgi:hypothetical protein|nr:hypothetical protein [Pelagibacteraceae bacterium]
MSKVFEVSSVVPTQKDIINETKNQYNNLKLQTNRYKFAKEVTDMLSDFAKLHQYDGSKDYKEAWNNWIKEEEVGNKLEDEKSRLIKMGMTDDVMSRLYKSSRYYYRKKSNNLNVEPKERKKYVGFPADILRTMDAQIIREINGSIDVIENDKIVSRFTPANSFELYLKENPESVNDLLSESSGSAEERRIETTAAVNRLKKTYKNRFYKIKVQIEEEDTK